MPERAVQVFIERGEEEKGAVQIRGDGHHRDESPLRQIKGSALRDQPAGDEMSAEVHDAAAMQSEILAL